MIRPNVLFLVLSLSCCAIAASLATEETNAGGAIFVAEIT